MSNLQPVPAEPAFPAPSPTPKPPIATVRWRNYSGAPFHGWYRTTVDVDLRELPCGENWMRGRRIMDDTWEVDVLVLFNGESQDIDLIAGGRPFLMGLPNDLIAWFGGALCLGGTPMEVVEHGPIGAAYEVHLCLRPASRPFLVVDAYLRWYPGEPTVHSTFTLTASNPDVEDVTAAFNSDELRLTWGNGIPVRPDGSWNGTVTESWAIFADGQQRVMPILWVFPARGLNNALALSSNLLAMVGVRTLLPHGNPLLPQDAIATARIWSDDPGAEDWPEVVEQEGGSLLLKPYTPPFQAPASPFRTAEAAVPSSYAYDWAVRHYQDAKNALLTWAHPGFGPNRNSADTGEQEGQMFCGSEPLQETGAIIPMLWGAYAMSKRPCQHREPDGSITLDHSHREPRGLMWDGRFDPRLGTHPGARKIVTPELAVGWWGPDVEHFMFARLWAAFKLTGDRACLSLIRQLAAIYPMQWTHEPGWSTSQMYAARAIGWECEAAVLWNEMKFTDMFASIATDHFRVRMKTVTLPQLEKQAREWGIDIWDVRVNDPRLGTGNWWLPYQQAIGAYRMDVAGDHLVIDAMRERALAGARMVMKCWGRDPDGGWSCVPVVAANQEATSPRERAFAFYGMALAPATILRHDQRDPDALELMSWLVAMARRPNQWSWIAPEAYALVTGSEPAF